jgi:hypothetical protein
MTQSAYPPSGPWTGYYLDGPGNSKHRMQLMLEFSIGGNILGDGIDDIALFLIDGSFDATTNQASWKKSYIQMHTVLYSGVYDGHAISGQWDIDGFTGGFRIWPGTSEDGIPETTSVAEEEPEGVLVG